MRRLERRSRLLSWRAVGQRATEHLDGVLSEQQGVDDTIQAGTRRDYGRFRLRRQMPGLGTGQMKLALQIGAGDLDVAHRHLRVDVAE